MAAKELFKKFQKLKEAKAINNENYTDDFLREHANINLFSTHGTLSRMDYFFVKAQFAFLLGLNYLLGIYVVIPTKGTLGDALLVVQVLFSLVLVLFSYLNDRKRIRDIRGTNKNEIFFIAPYFFVCLVLPILIIFNPVLLVMPPKR